MAVAWAVLAVGFGILSQIRAFSEPLPEGRPETGFLTYLGMLAILAGLTSVLGARRPGTGAWALLMIMLFVVLLVPLLESSFLTTRIRSAERLRLEAPWSLFVMLVAVAGVTNYLPTRWGWAAMLLGFGLAVEISALIFHDWHWNRRASLWSIVSGLWGLAILSTLLVRERTELDGRGTRHWFWFRDRWGVVWALRVAERFNQTAEKAKWPVRLSWEGIRKLPAGDGHSNDGLDAANTTFLTLIRRFATPTELERLKQELLEEA